MESIKKIFKRKDFLAQLIVVSIMVFCDVYYVRAPIILMYAVFLIFLGTIVSLVKTLLCKEKTDFQYKTVVVVLYILFLFLDYHMIEFTKDHFRDYKGIHVLD